VSTPDAQRERRSQTRGAEGTENSQRAWHSLDARRFRLPWFLISFSCVTSDAVHMQTRLPRRPRLGRLRLMSSGKRDQKKARKAATLKITTPQESADKPVITTAD
jgi:hypothetical protein